LSQVIQRFAPLNSRSKFSPAELPHIRPKRQNVSQDNSKSCVLRLQSAYTLSLVGCFNARIRAGERARLCKGMPQRRAQACLATVQGDAAKSLSLLQSLRGKRFPRVDPPPHGRTDIVQGWDGSTSFAESWCFRCAGVQRAIVRGSVPTGASPRRRPPGQAPTAWPRSPRYPSPAPRCADAWWRRGLRPRRSCRRARPGSRRRAGRDAGLRAGSASG
jgi:hypothetical protein